MVKLVFILFVIFSLISCGLIGIFPRENLRIKRTDQSASIEKLNLKVDGFYSYQSGPNEPFFKSFFYLFRNGVCFVSGYSASTGESKKNAEGLYFKQSTLPQNAPTGWGIYEIKKDSIYIEYWRIKSGDIVYIRAPWKGRIVNGKSIHMERERGVGVDTLFYFTPLNNKPDSTNRFIK